jgi:hypothetical protein
MVEPPAVNATGEPTGDAIGDAIGDPMGEASGDPAGEARGEGTDVGVIARVGIGAGVDVGSFDVESPPHAPTMMAISSNASSVLHEDVRIVRKVVPCPIGANESIQPVRGTVPESGPRSEIGSIPSGGGRALC